MHHLFHRGVVVRTLDGLDIIVFIVAFRGLHRLEDHTGGHRIRTRDIRVVEALDLIGQFGQVEFVLQFLHQTGLLLFGIQFLGLFQTVELILFAVHNREVEQGFFIA